MRLGFPSIIIDFFLVFFTIVTISNVNWIERDKFPTSECSNRSTWPIWLQDSALARTFALHVNECKKSDTDTSNTMAGSGDGTSSIQTHGKKKVTDIYSLTDGIFTTCESVYTTATQHALDICTGSNREDVTAMIQAGGSEVVAQLTAIGSVILYIVNIFTIAAHKTVCYTTSTPSAAMAKCLGRGPTVLHLAAGGCSAVTIICMLGRLGEAKEKHPNAKIGWSLYGLALTVIACFVYFCIVIFANKGRMDDFSDATVEADAQKRMEEIARMKKSMVNFVTNGRQEGTPARFVAEGVRLRQRKIDALAKKEADFRMKHGQKAMSVDNLADLFSTDATTTATPTPMITPEPTPMIAPQALQAADANLVTDGIKKKLGLKKGGKKGKGKGGGKKKGGKGKKKK